MKMVTVFTLIFWLCYFQSSAKGREAWYSEYQRIKDSHMIVGVLALKPRAADEMRFLVKDVLKGGMSDQEIVLPYLESYRATTESPAAEMDSGEIGFLFLNKSSLKESYLGSGWQGIITYRQAEYLQARERILTLIHLQAASTVNEKGRLLTSLLGGNSLAHQAFLTALLDPELIDPVAFQQLTLGSATASLLDSSDTIVRRDALFVLGKYREISELQKVIDMLNDDNVAVWSAANKALRKITKRNKTLPPSSTDAQRKEASEEWSAWARKQGLSKSNP